MLRFFVTHRRDNVEGGARMKKKKIKSKDGRKSKNILKGAGKISGVMAMGLFLNGALPLSAIADVDYRQVYVDLCDITESEVTRDYEQEIRFGSGSAARDQNLRRRYIQEHFMGTALS